MDALRQRRLLWQTAAEQRNYFYAGAVLEREINERLTLGVELFGNSPKERGSRSDVAFNIGGSWKLSEHFNLLFAGDETLPETQPRWLHWLQLLTK